MPKPLTDYILLPHLQHAVDHLAGDAEIIRRIDHLLQLACGWRACGFPCPRPAGRSAAVRSSPPRGRCRRRRRAPCCGPSSAPSPIITASDMIRPLVMSRFSRIFFSLTCRPSTTKRVCASAPADSMKISGSAIHSISHGPVARSWSSTMRFQQRGDELLHHRGLRGDVDRRDRVALLRHGRGRAAALRGTARRLLPLRSASAASRRRRSCRRSR